MVPESHFEQKFVWFRQIEWPPWQKCACTKQITYLFFSVVLLYYSKKEHFKLWINTYFGQQDGVDGIRFVVKKKQNSQRNTVAL